MTNSLLLVNLTIVLAKLAVSDRLDGLRWHRWASENVRKHQYKISSLKLSADVAGKDRYAYVINLSRHSIL